MQIPLVRALLIGAAVLRSSERWPPGSTRSAWSSCWSPPSAWCSSGSPCYVCGPGLCTTISSPCGPSHRAAVVPARGGHRIRVLSLRHIGRRSSQLELDLANDATTSRGRRVAAARTAARRLAVSGIRAMGSGDDPHAVAEVLAAAGLPSSSDRPSDVLSSSGAAPCSVAVAPDPAALLLVE